MLHPRCGPERADAGGPTTRATLTLVYLLSASTVMATSGLLCVPVVHFGHGWAACGGVASTRGCHDTHFCRVRNALLLPVLGRLLHCDCGVRTVGATPVGVRQDGAELLPLTVRDGRKEELRTHAVCLVACGLASSEPSPL